MPGHNSYRGGYNTNTYVLSEIYHQDIFHVRSGMFYVVFVVKFLEAI